MEGNLNALTTIFTEFYYWVTIVFMFLIHVGFCTYEVGVSRRRNHIKTLMKNAMAIPLVTVTFYFFGWWIYFRFHERLGVLQFRQRSAAPTIPNKVAAPWSPLMATHLSGANATDAALGITADGASGAAIWHRLNGVFWGAFLLFSITTASIVSGAIIERVRSGAFWIIAVMVGLGDVDPRRGLGLERHRLDGEAARLPRRLRVGRRACDRRRHGARRADRARDRGSASSGPTEPRAIYRPTIRGSSPSACS